MILRLLEKNMVRMPSIPNRSQKDISDGGHIATPKYPIVLAHGLMGFDKLRFAGDLIPGVEYWRGIVEALEANGVEVIDRKSVV